MPWLGVALLLALAAGMGSGTARAAVRVHALFSSNMVLQRGAPVTIWGWADEGEAVKVEFKGQKVSTVARAGGWSVRLAPMAADAKPASLIVEGRNKISFGNVVVGDVWLCSGQSNMERPLPESDTGAAAIAAANNPNLRLFTVARAQAVTPATNVVGQWQVSAPNTASSFSAVGYFFGRDLQKALNVPVGLICSAFSGSPAEAWMSRAFLESNADYYRDIIVPYEKNYERYERARQIYDRDAAVRAAQGLPPPTTPPPVPPWRPGELYNGMIQPLLPFSLRGVAWYQGEANVSRAWQYRALFPDLIRTWRTAWRFGTRNLEMAEMPFVAVQLAPFRAIKDQPSESDLAELREAQMLATGLAKVGVVVITDCGDPVRIHPRKKEPVGQRLALAARAIAYDQPGVSTSPRYRRMTIEGSRIVLEFDGIGGGLQWRGPETAGFAICGGDRRFVWAAQVQLRTNNTIAVSHPAVPDPVAVRYGWADYPVGNLWNSGGLPASPFRTDDFRFTTEPPGELAPVAGLGTAVTFDNESYIEIGRPPFDSAGENFTMELWVKNAALNDGQFHGLIGREDPTGTLGVNGRSPSLWQAPADGALHYDSLVVGGGHATGYLPGFFQGVDGWVHLAWVKEGGSYRFYRNGIHFGTRAAPARCYIEPTGFNIGRAGKSLWKGAIDLVRIWNTARTAEQIRDDAYRHLAGNETGLMASWAFDEGSGFVVDDGSKNHNWGSLRGNAAFTTDTPPVVFTTRVDTAITGCLPAVFSDGNAVTFISSKPPSSGQLLIDPLGGFRYRPALGESGNETFEYRVVDTVRRMSSVAVARINIMDSNLAPLAGFGSGLEFRGTGSVELSQSPFASGTTNFTLEMWVKNQVLNDGVFHGLAGFESAGTGTNQLLRSPSLWLAPINGGLHFDILSTTGQRYGNFIWGFFETNQVWVHVAWVKAGTVSRFYRNGVLLAERPAPGRFQLDPTGYSIGRAGKSTWLGAIDHVTVWNTARTPAEIVQDMFRGIRGTEPGLGGAWNFDEAAGRTVADVSRNRNHGVLQSTVNFTTDAPAILFSVPAGGTVSGFLPASDLNGNALVYSVVTPPATGGLLLNADGSFTCQSRSGFAGVELFTYRVSDGTDFSNTATVGILVRPPVTTQTR